MEKIIKENNLYAHFLQYSYKELKELFKKSKTKLEFKNKGIKFKLSDKEYELLY